MPKLLIEDDGNVFLDGTFVPENHHFINLKFNRTPAERAAISAARRQRRFENRQIKAYANGTGVNQPVSKEMPKMSAGTFYKTRGQQKREIEAKEYAERHKSKSFNYFQKKSENAYLRKSLSSNPDLRKQLSIAHLRQIRRLKTVEIDVQEDEETLLAVRVRKFPNRTHNFDYRCDTEFNLWGDNPRMLFSSVMKELVQTAFKRGVNKAIVFDPEKEAEMVREQVVPLCGKTCDRVKSIFVGKGYVVDEDYINDDLSTAQTNLDLDLPEVPNHAVNVYQHDEVSRLLKKREMDTFRAITGYRFGFTPNLMNYYRHWIERCLILGLQVADKRHKNRGILNLKQLMTMWVGGVLDYFEVQNIDLSTAVAKFVNFGLDALLACRATMYLIWEELSSYFGKPTAFGDEFADILKAFSRSELYEKGKAFLGKLAYFITTIQISDSFLLQKIKELLAPMFTWTGVGSLLYEFAQIIKQIVTGGYVWWTTGDWKSVFAADSASTWAIEADEAVLRVNELVTQPCTREAVLMMTDQLNHLIARGAELRAIKGIAARETGIIRNVEFSLKEALRRLSTSAPSLRPRPQPFVVQIHGESSVGKTSTTHAVVNLLLHHLDRPRETSQVDWKNSFDKYDTTAKEGQVGCVMNEMCAQKAQFDQTNQLLRFMQICDIAPVSVVKSESAEKGSFWLSYLFVIVSSNLRNLNAHHRVDNPNAVLRRLEFLLEVSVKEEFRIYEDGNKSNVFAIDLEKLNGRDIIEAQQYRIFQRKAYAGKVVEEQMFLDKCDVVENDTKWMSANIGMSCLLELYKRHSMRQDSALSHIDNYYARSACDTCKNLFCTCRVVPTAFMNYSYIEIIVTYFAILFHYGTYFAYKWLKNYDPERAKMYVWNELERLRVNTVARITSAIDVKYAETRKRALQFIVGIGVLGGIYATYKYVFSEDKVKPTINVKSSDVEIDLALSNSKPFMYPVSNEKHKVNRVVHVRDGFTNATKITTPERFLQIVKSCTVLVSFGLAGSTSCPRAVGWRYDGRYLLMNKHDFYIDGVCRYDDRVIFIKSEHQTFKPQVICNLDIAEIGGDMVLVHVASLNYPVVSLKSYISHATGETSFNTTGNYLLRIDKVDDNPERWFETVMVPIFDLKAKKFQINDYFVTEGVEFSTKDGGFQVGHSGSMIISLDSTKILGMLCGGVGPSPHAIGMFQITPEIPLQLEDDINPFYTVAPTALSVDLEDHTSEYSILDHFIDKSGSARYLGTIKGYVHNRPKTNIRKSLLFEDVAPKMESVPVVPILHPRVLHTEFDQYVYVDPYNVSCSILNSLEGFEPPALIVSIAYRDYISVFDDIPVDPRKKGGPLNCHQALNGTNPIMKMDFNTAAGIPLGGKKKSYFYQKEDLSYDFREGVEDLFVAYMKAYAKGFGRPIMSAHIKDEVKKAEKIAAGLERMFNGSPLFFTILSRMYLLPIIQFIMDHAREFEHCVGINCMDPTEWGTLYNDLKSNPHRFDGDFAKFDLRHLRTVLLFYVTFCVDIARKYLDYTDHDIRMVIQIITDMIYYVVCVKGDLVEFSQGFCSGAIITVMINSFVVCIYMRLAWIIAGHVNVPFRLKNVLRVYGDDNVNSTKEKSFSFLTVRDNLKVYGLVYTPSDKSDNPQEFMEIEQISFLKRKFKSAMVLGQEVVLCPLEEQSILKSLLYVKCPRNEEKLQVAKNIVDAQKQYWYHGVEVFEDRKAWLKELAAKHDVCVAETGTKDSIRWFADSELAEQYLSHSMTIAFT
jgi:hypothetical protein